MPRRGRGGRGAVRLVGRRAPARQGLRRLHGRRAPGGPPRDARGWRGAARRGRAAARAPPAAAAPRRTRPGRTCARTMRASLRTAGDPFERHWREPVERPRPLVLVCDVSGSMEPYARMLLQYMQACVAARRRVEAFVFGTRLTRVTARARRARPRPRARPRRRARRSDWSGGTRIGEALADAQPRARPPHRPRRGRRAPLGRLGPRRAGAARRRDGAPARAARTA